MFALSLQPQTKSAPRGRKGVWDDQVTELGVKLEDIDAQIAELEAQGYSLDDAKAAAEIERQIANENDKIIAAQSMIAQANEDIAAAKAEIASLEAQRGETSELVNLVWLRDKIASELLAATYNRDADAMAARATPW